MRVMTAAGEVMVGVILMMAWVVMRLVEGRPAALEPSQPTGAGEQLRLPGIADPHEW